MPTVPTTGPTPLTDLAGIAAPRVRAVPDATVLAVSALAASGRLARAEAAQGQIAALPELNVEITALQADLTLVQARAARPADTVALFQALGGGWSASPTAKGAGSNAGKR